CAWASASSMRPCSSRRGSASRPSRAATTPEAIGAGELSAIRSEQAVEVIEVVDDAPAPAALLDPGAPVIEPREILARIEVVRVQLGDVERDHLEAVEVHRDVAHVALRQLLLHVREDEDLLAARVLLVQELDRLQQSPGDVGEGRGP